MNITIVGGGNVGTQFAVHCAEKKHQVIIFGSKPKAFHDLLYIIDESAEIRHKGKIIEATSDPERAFAKAELIFVTMPSFCMRDVAEQIFPYVRPDVMIGLIPGTGGGECAFRKCLDKGAVVFGLQRVPSVARLVEYGKSVCAIGYREKLHIAALPYKYTEKVCELIYSIFDIRCEKLPNYLNVTLTPSNPILHTTRLKTIFSDYYPGKYYDSLPLFYEDWTDESSVLLLACDDEVQQICKKLSRFDLSGVISLRKHYESSSIEEMTKKISGIKGFQGLETPAVRTEKGFIPDLQSRYFIADFSYGLTILTQIADFAGVEAINLKETLMWYQNIIQQKKGFDYGDYAIRNDKDFMSFYIR